MIAKVHKAYEKASQAKAANAAAIESLKEAAKAARSERDDFTMKLSRERPDLVNRITDAYREGERIKDAMQLGGRWPRNSSKSTYVQILRDVPPEQRSAEMRACMEAWEKFQAAADEIARAFPPPEHYYWNGATLMGPNLYGDFGIAGAQND
jgi:hypothetical protein